MARKSGKDFANDYNGSTGSDGEVRRVGNWRNNGGETWINGESSPGHTYISKEQGSNTKRNDHHLHYRANPAPGEKYHDPNSETSQRISSIKGEAGSTSNDLMGNFAR